MRRRRVTAIAVANGQLVYTIEDRPKAGARPLCGVVIVLGAGDHHLQRTQAESPTATLTAAESGQLSSRPAPDSTPATPE